jgi:glucosamine-6-phosphate isomerase
VRVAERNSASASLVIAMEIRVYDDYDAVSLHTASIIADYVKMKPNAILCLPAGDTPAGAFRHLVQLNEVGDIDFKHCTFLGLDEWVGLGRHDNGSCTHFMYDHLFTPLGIAESQIQFFDAIAEDLPEECHRIDEWILKNGPIDLMYLGLGLNGHIGLNEPGVDVWSSAHLVQLDESTKSVAQKYFAKQTPLQSGVTLGIKQIMETNVVILGVSGIKKANVVKNVVQGEISNQLPASILRNHKHSILVLDRLAASCLEETE